jgi:hypothetical protein
MHVRKLTWKLEVGTLETILLKMPSSLELFISRDHLRPKKENCGIVAISKTIKYCKFLNICEEFFITKFCESQ